MQIGNQKTQNILHIIRCMPDGIDFDTTAI